MAELLTVDGENYLGVRMAVFFDEGHGDGQYIMQLILILQISLQLYCFPVTPCHHNDGSL